MTELFHDFMHQAALIPRAVLLGLLVFIVTLYFEDGVSKERIRHILGKVRSNPWRLVFSVYTALVILMTVLIRDTINPYQNIFADVNLMKNGKINLEVVKNTLLFIPYTFLFHQAFYKKNDLKATLILSFFTATFIELCQLTLWLGEFQISDMVFNMIGGMIGHGLWLLMRRVINQK